jgi:hypothetical protein
MRVYAGNAHGVLGGGGDERLGRVPDQGIKPVLAGRGEGEGLDENGSCPRARRNLRSVERVGEQIRDANLGRKPANILAPSRSLME